MNVSTLAVLALSLASAAPALAQLHPQVRDAGTFSVGVGSGAARLSCKDCVSDRQQAPSLYIRLGGAYRPDLIFGAEIDAWSKSVRDVGSDGDVRFTVATLDAIAQWYPQASGGFFLLGGFGLGTVHADFDAPGLTGTISDRTTAYGYQLGTGYDIRLGRLFSITPYATLFGTSGGKIEGNGTKLDANVTQVGIGFTWH